MAGAKYEVNIVLKTQEAEAQLRTLEKNINTFRQNVLKKTSGAIDSSVNKTKAQGIALRRLATQMNSVVNKTVKTIERVNRQQLKLLPDSKALNAAARGIQRLEKTQTSFAERQAKAQARSLRNGERELQLSDRRNAAIRRRQQLLAKAGAAGTTVLPTSGVLGPSEKEGVREQMIEHRFRLARKIDVLEAKGVQTAKLRANLGKLTTAYTRGNFGLAKQLIGPLSRSVRLEQAKLKLQKDQTAELKKQQAGGIKLRQIAEQFGRLNRKISRIDQPAGQLALPSSRMLGGDARGLQRLQAVETSEQRTAKFAERTANAKARSAKNGAEILASSRASAKAGERNAVAAERQANATARTRRRRGRRIAGDVALGAGFPLLFGGGPGAVLGGALGGLTGGGLAAQIGFSALGQLLDKLGASAINLGKALSDVNPDVGRLAEAAGFAGTETEMLLDKIERYGDKAQAAQLATKLLSTQVGEQGVKALKDFGDSAVKLGNALGVIFSQVLANIAKVAGPLLKKLAEFAGRESAIGAFKAGEGGTAKEVLARDILQSRNLFSGAAPGASPAARAELSGFEERARKLGVNAIGPQELSNFARQTALAKQSELTLPVIEEIKLAAGNIEDPKEKSARRRLQASERRIALLGVETEKQKQITAFKDRIAQLELDGDKMSITRLQGEQRLLDIAAQKERAILRISQELPLQQQLAERAAINEKFAAQEVEARAQTERELNVLQRERDQEHMNALKQHIEMQYQLNTAIQQQLQLADSISQVMGQGMTQAFDLLIDGAQNWGMALRDIAANVLRDIARQLIQIYVIEQAIGFMKGLLSPGSAGGQVPIGHGGGTVQGPTGQLGTLGPNYGIPTGRRAKGGPVSSGMPYLVGERGPELFIPGAQGTVVPNNAMGGVQVGTINISVENTGEQLSPAAQKQIANQVQGIVMSTLVNERRSGGVLR